MFTYPDVEDMAKAWLKTTSVAGLVNNKIFLAMPKGVPMPSVVLSRVGGSPVRGSAAPVDSARVSFDCWADDRPTAKTIAKTLVAEVENLALDGPYTSITENGKLHVGEVVSWIWLPDSVSDKPRYIVDVTFTSTML